MMLPIARTPISLRTRLRTRLRARLIRLALLFTILPMALALAGCASTGGPAIPGTGPLVTVQLRGGMCPNGPCDHTVILDRDGRVHSAEKPPNDRGRVPAAAMATLTAAVQATDYARRQIAPLHR